MAGIGIWAMRQVKGQEDYFMGGRKFGKLFQTFAAFGAGTGSADPVNTARGTFANGMSGMWGVMYWLFVTPIYWISGVWYRRMRCLTLGDWFTERYESKSIGVAYALFGCFYYMVYGAMLFTAIGKVAVPLMGSELFGMPTGQALIPLVALIVIVYGVLGGEAVGFVTSPWYHPEKKQNIAMGYVPFDGTLNANGLPKGNAGTKYKVHLPEKYSETPGQPVDATVVDIPFKESYNANTREVVNG